ncbi:helix-turn-helix transcriptional regulator [Wenjunlia tyrosinilytica]|uniref:helix-turn-helix transcriptional regulator n=1 Tax=Wenjunlia tyrosinilytica TaxID=1544741 RepID=UPI001E46B1BE|nr:AAA family ATPase [Wenjunlia tyrosinilytica]
MVGRSDELAALDALAEEVLSGRTRVVQLQGPAGFGKSTLLHFWLDRVRQFNVLRVRCPRLESEFAFGTVRRLLRPLMAAASDSDRLSLLEGAGETALRLLDPEGCQNGLSEACADAAETLRSLDTLVFRLSRRQPLLLAVDDLQWIDPPSLRWLARLVHRAETHPILVAATTRTGERPEPGQPFSALLHPSTCRTLVLGPLGARGVEELVGAVLGGPRPDPSFSAACHAATDGNPLFLRALLWDALGSGVEATSADQEKIRSFGLRTVSREIGHRLSNASEDMADLARGLAILGDHMPPTLLAAYCGKGEAVIRSAAAELHSSGLLRAGDDLCFVHPVVREVVLGEWPAQEVGEAHARAAHVLHLSGRPDEEVAAHLLAAGPVPGSWVLTVLRRAAEKALRRGAPQMAVTYLRHAVHQQVQPGEGASLLVQLAVAASHYDCALAMSYGTAALESLTDELARFEVVCVLAYSHLLSSGAQARVPDLDRLTADLSKRADAASTGREAALRAYALRYWLEFEHPGIPTDAAASGAVLDAELAGNTPGERQLLAIRAFNAVRAARPASGITETVERICVNPPPFSHELFPLHYFLAQSLLYLDELERAEDLCARLSREARQKGLELATSSLLVYRAAVWLRRGDIKEAAAAARAASEGTLTAGELPHRMTLDAIRIDTLLELGDLHAAEQIAEAYSSPGPAAVSREWPRFLMSLAALRTAQGDLRAGLSLLRECGHHLESAGTVNPAIAPWRSRAAAAHRALGNHGEARALIEQELDLARRCQIPRALGVALLAAGTATDGARGLAQLAEAASLLEGTPADLELARALYHYGSALLRRDDKRGARTALRRGLGIAVRRGGCALATRLNRRLHDAGGRLGSRGADSRTLTTSEERVAALAVQGCSNKQIAERLFVSLRTVETHLTGVYRKLHISGRSELGAVLGGTSFRGRADTSLTGSRSPCGK